MKLWCSFTDLCIVLLFAVFIFDKVETSNICDKVTYLLNQRRGPIVAVNASDPDSLKPLQNSKIKVFKFFTHGYGAACTDEPNTLVPLAYKKNRKYASICVDWSPLSYHNEPEMALKYTQAADNTKIVGKCIADFVTALMNQKEPIITDLNSVHFVGWSLGAHVMGVAGNKLNGRVGRISGLDPAGPEFGKEKPLSERLDKTDAKYVDVIHTNAGQLGTDLVIGHSDFYPNGGMVQLKCGVKENVEDLAGHSTCSHTRAPIYFAKSITNPKYATACKCDSWLNFEANKCDCKNPKNIVPFGESSKNGTLGTFYLTISKV